MLKITMDILLQHINVSNETIVHLHNRLNGYLTKAHFYLIK